MFLVFYVVIFILFVFVLYFLPNVACVSRLYILDYLPHLWFSLRFY